MSRVLLLLICFFIVPLQAFAKDSLLDIQEVVSEGGITAWLVEDHSVPVIAMEAGFFYAGAAYDPPSKQGLSRLASNTMDEGAGGLDAKEFQKELRDQSITLRFKSGRDHFGASLKTLTKNKARAFELLELALTKPRFDKDAVERMRKANQSRIRSSLSDPSWMAARLMNDVAFEGHPYAMNSGGTLSGLEAISAGDLEDFHENRIGKNNLHVAVAGDITAEELKDVLDRLFGDLPDVELEPLPPLEVKNGGKVFVYKQDIPQTMIEIMQPGIAQDDPDYQAAQVMNFILGSSGFGSRLTEEIREKRGLTYGIYSQIYNLKQMNALSFTTSTATENAGEMIALIKAELIRLISEPVAAKELQDAKTYLIGSLPLSLTSTDRIAGLMLDLQMDGRPVDYLDQRKAKIETLSIADIQAVAAKILSPDNFTIVMVGQPDIQDAILKKGLPNVE